MDPLTEEPFFTRAGRIGLFVLSAAAAAFILHFAWDQPFAALGALVAIAIYVLVRWLTRRRMRRALLSGDVEKLLREWAPSLERAPYASTMGPLMTATAFAVNGWAERARAAMSAAERGPVWEAALEHRLFLDTLLLTLEGDPDTAEEQAQRLSRLPLPQVARPMQARIELLRRAMVALPRAFSHRTEPGDDVLLDEAVKVSPLVFWAMRYASAVIAIDRGDLRRAREIIAAAPKWPAESVFRAFHDEIANHAA